MKRHDLNKLLYEYHFFYSQFMKAKAEYEEAKATYRRFAEADNQIGKPGHHLPYDPPLTKMKKCDIRKIEAARCLDAKNRVKRCQRTFEITRKEVVGLLCDSGLRITN